MRQSARTICLLALLVSMSSFAASDELKCNPDGDTQQMTACIAQDFRRADAQLNITYTSRMETLSQPDRTDLRAEQREWLKHRDPKCKQKVKDSEGGSIWPMEFYGCLKTSTTRRTKEVAAWRSPKS